MELCDNELPLSVLNGMTMNTFIIITAHSQILSRDFSLQVPSVNTIKPLTLPTDANSVDSLTQRDIFYQSV